MTKTCSTRLGRYVPLVLVLFSIAAAYAMDWHRALSLEALVGNRAAIDAFVHSQAVVAILAYIGLYAAATAGALPAGAGRLGAGGGLFRRLARGRGRPNGAARP